MGLGLLRLDGIVLSLITTGPCYVKGTFNSTSVSKLLFNRRRRYGFQIFNVAETRLVSLKSK